MFKTAGLNLLMLAFSFNYIVINNEEHVISLWWLPLFVFVLRSCLPLFEGGSCTRESYQTSESYNWLLSFLDLSRLISALDSFSNEKNVEKGPLTEESTSSEISAVSIPI